MTTLAVILSVAGTVCSCAPSLIKGKNMKLILLLIFLSNAFVGTGYVLTGAFSGAVSSGVGAIQTLINYIFERKNKPIPAWLVAIYALVLAMVNLLTFAKLADVFALLACLAFVMCIVQKSGKQYRVWVLTNGILWIAYDLTGLSFGPLVTHLLQTAIAVFGIILHDRKSEKSVLSLTLQDKTNDRFYLRFSAFDYGKFTDILLRLFEEHGYSFTSLTIFNIHDWDEPGNSCSYTDKTAALERLSHTETLHAVDRISICFNADIHMFIGLDATFKSVSYPLNCTVRPKQVAKRLIHEYRE